MVSEEKFDYDEEFKPQEDSGLNSLHQAYNNREVSLTMLIVGACIIAALAGILVALVFFG